MYLSSSVWISVDVFSAPSGGGGTGGHVAGSGGCVEFWIVVACLDVWIVVVSAYI